MQDVPYFVVEIKSVYLQGFRVMNNDLTLSGKPRQRAPGAGRPPKHGQPTKSVRIPQSVLTELVAEIPNLQAILDYWEDACGANPNSARHYFLRQAINEIRALGF